MSSAHSTTEELRNSDQGPAFLQRLQHLPGRGLADVLSQLKSVEGFIYNAYCYFLRQTSDIPVVYALDSDVFYPMIRPFVQSSRHALAVQFTLQNIHGPFFLPPGCLFELIIHLEKECKFSQRFNGLANEIESAGLHQPDQRLASELVQSLSGKYPIGSPESVAPLMRQLTSQGRSVGSVTGTAITEIARAATRHSAYLQTLVTFFEKNEFIDGDSDLIAGDPAIRSKIRTIISQTVDQRGMTDQRNLADATNLASVIAHRQRLNDWLRNGRNGPQRGHYMEMMTFTPGLFRIPLPVEWTQDELLLERGEAQQAGFRVDSNLVKAPWDALFIAVIGNKFANANDNLSLSFDALQQVQLAIQTVRKLLHQRQAESETKLRHLPTERLRALLEALQLRTTLTEQQAQILLAGLAGYLENSRLEKLREIIEADASEEWEKAKTRESGEPMRILQHATARNARLATRVLRLLGHRPVKDSVVLLDTRAPSPNTAHGPGPFVVSSRQKQLTDAITSEIALRRFVIEYVVKGMETDAKKLMCIDCYPNYYSAYWTVDSTLDDFCKALSNWNTERLPDGRVFQTTIWMSDQRITVKSGTPDAADVRETVARTTSQRLAADPADLVAIPCMIQFEAPDVVFHFDVVSRDRRGPRTAGIVSTTDNSDLLARLFVDTGSTPCPYKLIESEVRAIIKRNASIAR